MKRSAQQIEDEMLVMLARSGSPKALAALVTRWHPRLIAFARKLCDDHSTTNDIVQNAWISIAQNLHRLDDPARFPAWALRIVANKATDMHRSKKRRQKYEKNTPPVHQPDPNEITSTRQLVQHALKRLNEDHRSILVLHYARDLAIEQIAELLGVPSGTVKSRLHAARSRLKDTIAVLEKEI